MPVSLCDEIELEPADELVCETTAEEGVDISRLGASSDNLAVKAARIMAVEARRECALRIAIRKRIPLGGGMGGGSADA
ncbi:MAG: 4-(cytidine 5'-diphospho)-2-C-methyl-D-erythritol kinase, partial [Kiritimatiellae bacterium]|nr:4-(cytidine 5'-diphospho)-2-C-methyl-D-erythritol kinase [Kiritimatiellia bacterium]